jgi:hypothetical protein
MIRTYRGDLNSLPFPCQAIWDTLPEKEPRVRQGAPRTEKQIGDRSPFMLFHLWSAIQLTVKLFYKEIPKHVVDSEGTIFFSFLCVCFSFSLSLYNYIYKSPFTWYVESLEKSFVLVSKLINRSKASMLLSLQGAS